MSSNSNRDGPFFIIILFRSSLHGSSESIFLRVRARLATYYASQSKVFQLTDSFPEITFTHFCLHSYVRNGSCGSFFPNKLWRSVRLGDIFCLAVLSRFLARFTSTATIQRILFLVAEFQVFQRERVLSRFICGRRKSNCARSKRNDSLVLVLL